jgi:hypothetical protein
METPQLKVYSSRKHPNDMKYGKRSRQRGWFCSCGGQFCDNGTQRPIATSGKTGSRKKTKGLGLKEQKEKQLYECIDINYAIVCRNEEEED